MPPVCSRRRIVPATPRRAGWMHSSLSTFFTARRIAGATKWSSGRLHGRDGAPRRRRSVEEPGEMPTRQPLAAAGRAVEHGLTLALGEQRFSAASTNLRASLDRRSGRQDGHMAGTAAIAGGGHDPYCVYDVDDEFNGFFICRGRDGFADWMSSLTTPSLKRPTRYASAAFDEAWFTLTFFY